MTTLILGASGLLGSNVAETASQRTHEVIGTFRTNRPTLSADCYHCDLSAPEHPRTLIDRHEPELVVNCAALSNVDECEGNPETAQVINEKVPGELAKLCRARGITLVHTSTDYVFDGAKSEPYTETDETAPLQVYGRTKRAGEIAVRDHEPAAIVVRLSFLFGVHRSSNELSGFPAWVRSQLTADENVPLFTDQHVTPSRAKHVAESLFDLVGANESGVFHVACRDCVTPFQFGQLIAEQMTTNSTLERVSRADVERDAARPDYTCLDVSRIEERLGRPQPTLREELLEMDVF